MTRHWLFPGFSSLVSFFMRRRSVWLSVLLLEVRWAFVFCFFGGAGELAVLVRMIMACENSPNFSCFCGSFAVTPCAVLCWRLMRDEYLNAALCFVFVAFTCVFGTCEARFMKDSSSARDSEIHKHLPDKGYFLLLLPDPRDLLAKVHSPSH